MLSILSLVFAANLATYPTPEAQFRCWYSGTDDVVRLNYHPDDPAHRYDYRALHRAMLAGHYLAPMRAGAPLPAAFKLPGQRKTYLPTMDGRCFNTRTSRYAPARRCISG